MNTGLQPGLPPVECAVRTDPGRDPDKQVNEDASGHRETRFGQLCVVCDGMGGHAAGREAADLALATIFQVFENAPAETPPARVLGEAVEEASRRVHVMTTGEVSLGRPGSTAVAVLMHAQGTEVAHVGDSRAYMVHEGQIIRVTRDHSVVQDLVDRGLLTPEQAMHHPDANRITRALGMAVDVQAEVRPEPVHHVAGDTFVLCSDGLSDLVEDQEILTIVAAEPPAQAAGKLVDLANARGGHDNITVVVLRARETALSSGAGVAHTLVQTAVTQAPVGLAAPTLIETQAQPQADRRTAPVLAAVIPTAPDPLPIPPMGILATRRRRTHPAVIVGVLVAIAALAVMGLLLYGHIQERGGKRNASGASPLPSVDLQSVPSATSLVPQPVVVPTMSSQADPIAPLSPSPSASTKRSF